MTTINTAWRPAWYCPRAVHTLRWDDQRLAWVLRHHDTVLGVLPGYSVGQPANDHRRAAAWAAGQIPGPWIQRPTRSGTYHTH